MNHTKTISFCLILFLSFALTNCKTNKQEVRSTSPDGTAEIIVSGTKTGMNPWNLIIEVKKDGKSDTRETELYSDKLDAKSVIFLWENDTKCLLKLTEQDGTTRMLEINI